jgi:hypothetical protein
LSSDEAPTATYVRGAGGAPVSGRLLLTVIVAMCLLILFATGLAFAVERARDDARITKLKHHGVAVEATVTRCLGILSGTGVTEVGFTCHVRYVVAGQVHTATLHGTTALYRDGATVPAVTLRQQPSPVYTAAYVRSADTSWRRYGAAAALMLSALLGGAVGLVLLRSTSHRH